MFRKPVSLPRRKAIRRAKKSCKNGTDVAHAKGGAFFAPVSPSGRGGGRPVHRTTRYTRGASRQRRRNFYHFSPDYDFHRRDLQLPLCANCGRSSTVRRRSNGLRRRHLADQCSAPFQWVSGVYSQSGCPRYFGSPAFSRRSCDTFRFSRSRYHSLVMKLVVVRLEFPAIASSASLRASSGRSSAISAAAP